MSVYDIISLDPLLHNDLLVSSDNCHILGEK